jgi:hypothetical protein
MWSVGPVGSASQPFIAGSLSAMVRCVTWASSPGSRCLGPGALMSVSSMVEVGVLIFSAVCERLWDCARLGTLALRNKSREKTSMFPHQFM